MSTESNKNRGSRTGGPAGGPTITRAVRQRLQAVFEHAQKCAEKGDYDYANDLFTQCVVEDPGNLIYVQHFLGNLANKFGNSKKGARFSQLKVKSARMSLNRAVEKGHWQEAFQAGANALKWHPWDAPTLVLLARTCGRLTYHECQLYYLRWALDAVPKDATVNREAALALAAIGQFDQAIGCWKRVQESKPGDQEASKAISQLSVDKTIRQGGYDQNMLTGKESDRQKSGSWSQSMSSSASSSAETLDVSESAGDHEKPAEERGLLTAIERDPAEIEPYRKLADYYSRQNRYPDAERVLTRALSASGGDLRIREMLEDAQLQRIRQQVEIARQRAERDRSEQTVALFQRMQGQANQAELEIFAARSAREPNSMTLQYELGVRLKQAGKFREAIQAFQSARDDLRRKARVQIHLGECFQHIRQFKLAADAYEKAVDACEPNDVETRKLALYRAGVLAGELGDTDLAERHLTTLAAIDFAYRDVADRLDKIAAMRDSV